MPSKTYTFTLGDSLHTVEIAYSMLTGWERVTVDENVLFEGIRWTMESHHPFQIGSHDCVATLRIGMADFVCELKIDGQPFEMLPEQSYLRAASAPSSEQANELLRAANDPGATPPEELLRPSKDNTETA